MVCVSRHHKRKLAGVHDGMGALARNTTERRPGEKESEVLLRLAAHLIVAVLLTARWQHNRCRAQFSASNNLPQGGLIGAARAVPAVL